jgi:hypothetical protein
MPGKQQQKSRSLTLLSLRDKRFGMTARSFREPEVGANQRFRGALESRQIGDLRKGTHTVGLNVSG